MKHLGLTASVLLGIAGAVVLGAAVYGISNAFLRSDSSTQAHRCDGKHTHYIVRIQNSTVVPRNVQASLCDKLTITNLDHTERLLAFGPHDHHISYDGMSEQLLAKNQSLDITLTRSGTYLFHDHLDDAHVYGTFTVGN